MRPFLADHNGSGTKAIIEQIHGFANALTSGQLTGTCAFEKISGPLLKADKAAELDVKGEDLDNGASLRTHPGPEMFEDSKEKNRILTALHPDRALPCPRRFLGIMPSKGNVQGELAGGPALPSQAG